MPRKPLRPGRRGAFLAVIGLLHAAFGVGLLTVPPSEQAAIRHVYRIAILPPWVWGVLWLLTGAVAVIDGAVRANRTRVGFIVGVLMPAVWVVVLTGAWLTGDLPRGWITAALFAALAASIAIVAGMPDEPLAVPLPTNEDRP